MNTKKLNKGRILDRVKGYLNGIGGNPALVKIQGKNNNTLGKTLKKDEEKLRKTYVPLLFYWFSMFSPPRVLKDEPSMSGLPSRPVRSMEGST